MGNNWEKKPLSSLCNGIGDGVHGTPKYVVESPYCFINGNNLKDGRVDTSSAKRVDGDEYQKHFVELDETTLLMSINGTLGSLALYRGEPVILGKSAAYIRCRDISREFCYYYFQLRETQRAFFNIATGSTIKNLSLDSIKNFHIPVPSVQEQNRIAAVLSALDAKIALNQRINLELEGMAKLLYDYWFVQYDFPLSAAQAAALGKPRLAGQPYRTSGGKMVFNPTLKREIPVGWEASSIGEIFKTNLGGTPSRKEATYWNPGEIAWLSSGEKEQLFVSSPDETISRKGLANSPATLLPAGTVILSIVRHIRASILAIEAATNQSVLGIKETADIKHCFIYPFIMGEIPRYMILRTGAQQPHINKGTVDETPLVIPAPETLKAYTAIAAPIFEQIQNLEQQNQELTALRDWLLPMLMNGQVRVTE